MTKKMMILDAALLALALLLCRPAGAVAPKAADYYVQPPLLIGSTKPAILMVLSKDMDIFAPAYVAPGDHDGDGDMDVGFNPAVVYTGLFDPYSCYTYNWQNDGSNSGSATDTAKNWSVALEYYKRGHFVRLGPSIEDKEDAVGQYKDANRLPKEIRDGYDDASNGRPGFPAPRSATGICPAKNHVDGSQDMDSHGKNMTNADPKRRTTFGETRIWSGNWLNWLTSSRLDVIRQVLYGGKRVVDLPHTTYIAAEWIPENAGVWSYDDFTKYFWLDYNEGAVFYDTTKYTPVDPDRFGGKYRRLHSYGRSGNRFYIYDNIWFLRQKEDVTNHEGFRSYNAYFPPKFRNQYNPLIYVLNAFADREKTAYWEVTLEACVKLTKEEVYEYTSRLDYSLGRTGVSRPKNKDAIPEEALLEAGDYCEPYGAYHKPVGLLQRYAKRDQALFGLMTGAFSDLNRWDGGWLRHNVASIKRQVNADGTYKGTAQDNIFLMLDSISQQTKPKLNPLNEKRDAVDATARNRGQGWQDPYESNFGNPVGEMLYAGLLYFARDSAASYQMYPSASLMGLETVKLPRLGDSGEEPWRSPLFAGHGDCLYPVILLLSSTTTSHDGDMLPGSPHGLRDGAGSIPTLSLPFYERKDEIFKNAAGLAAGFDLKGYLDVITRLEGFGGKSFYIANLNTGAPGAVTEGSTSRQPADPADTNLCVPRILTSLADVRGLCPASPQTYGTYSAAAVAYYGNTHDFDKSRHRVQTFAVALPSIFPKINLESRGRVISIAPVAMSVTHPCGRDDGDRRFCKDGGTDPKGIQYVGPFTTNVIQWRADDRGRVYSGAVFAGFTGRLEGEGDDYQLDAPVRYYFDLIRECRPGECDRGNVESFRYTGKHPNKEGYPSRDDERDITYTYFHQPFIHNHAMTNTSTSAGSRPVERKYKDFVPDIMDKTLNDEIIDTTLCNDANRDRVSACGGARERQTAVAIMEGYFKDGRYAGAPFKRHREWVYKSWDHAGRPNYILSGERPKNYHIAAYMPKRWSQLPAYFHRPTGILTSQADPDPTLMQSYARLVYPEFGGVYDSGGSADREKIMRTLPGAQDFQDKSSNAINYVDTVNGKLVNRYHDTVFDETESLFIDRPFTDLGYEEVMDVYGYIGDPYKVYKKVSRPEEIDEAVGVAVFVYSLEEKIDLSDRNMPMNIGYYLHGGFNYARSKAEDPNRRLGNAEGTYLEIQNEHNYMGGGPQKVLNEGTVVHRTNGEEFGLMTIAHPLNTPPTCYRAGTVSFNPMNFLQAERSPALFKNGVTGDAQMPGFWSDADKRAHKIVTPACGSPRLPLTATRFFRFPTGEAVEPANYLPDPLWLAAKYGGFDDGNMDGIPQKDEYDALPPPNGDGIPDNYFYAATLSELKDKLTAAFERIMSSMNVGTATSASVNSVLGGGVTVRTFYQTLHATKKVPDAAEIRWLGGTYALFIDLWGNMREDTNRNGRLDLACGFEDDPGSKRGDNAAGDWIVEFVNCGALDDGPEKTECYKVPKKSDIETVVRLYPDQNGKNYKDPSRVEYHSLEDLRTVWNLSRNLSALSEEAIVTPRSSYKNLADPRRRVYYHHESLGTNYRFSDRNLFQPAKGGELYQALLQPTAAEGQKLIEYVLGKDFPNDYRPRTTVSPWYDLDQGTGTITCRLGDIINSQPIISGAPFSNYDYLYGDASYARYRVEFGKRRHLAVVGANDGMLHAVNMGVPISMREGYNGYTDENKDFIGREMWAFIPQSILPHLQWLSRTDYAHSYYLDLTPTVVEAKNASGQWRTVLLGSLRFGGRAIETGPGQYSWSEVFALDITDPDQEPVLLWRFSHPRMGLVVTRPTVVRNNASGDSWQVLVASGPTYDEYVPSRNVTVPAAQGPTAYKGYSNQSAKIFVFDLNAGPGPNNSNVKTIDTGRPMSFFTNVQVLTAPGSTVKREASGEVSWQNTLAYFSLTQSALDGDRLCLQPGQPSTGLLDAGNPADRCPSASKYGNEGWYDKGGVWRLRMTGPVASWQANFKPFFDGERPITAAVNTTFDPAGRLWVIFGSGRYWSNDDASVCAAAADPKACQLNHVNYLYGIKEPVDSDGEMTYETAREGSLMDVSNIVVYPDGEAGVLGRRGELAPMDLGGRGSNVYDDLYAHLLSPSVGGYRRALKTDKATHVDSVEVDAPGDDRYQGGETWWDDLDYEMILEQVAVAPYRGGSVMSLSTFLPKEAACGSNGVSYGMLLDTFTGLPKPAFGEAAFTNLNKLPDSKLPASAPGLKPVNDHFGKVDGQSAAAVFVVTGTNESKHGQFEIVNSDGTVTVFRLPDDDLPRGGVISWREVLDFSAVGLP